MDSFLDVGMPVFQSFKCDEELKHSCRSDDLNTIGWIVLTVQIKRGAGKMMKETKLFRNF